VWPSISLECVLDQGRSTLPNAAIAATAIRLHARLVTADEAFAKLGKECTVLIYKR